MKSILSTVSDRFRNWWRNDAIRISPKEGHLLRVRCPCIVRIDHCEAVLHERVEELTGEGVHVILRGATVGEERDCELEVSTDSPDVLWTVASESHCLTPREVLVFPCA